MWIVHPAGQEYDPGKLEYRPQAWCARCNPGYAAVWVPNPYDVPGAIAQIAIECQKEINW